MTDQEKQEYIKKRQTIWDILVSLFWEWELAEGLFCLVWSKYITKEALDSLIDVISSAMKNIEEQNKTQKIQKSIQQLDEMKQQELNQKEEEKKQAESIFLELGLV